MEVCVLPWSTDQEETSMILDGHIHVQTVAGCQFQASNRFTAMASSAGIAGGLVMSPYPTEFP